MDQSNLARSLDFPSPALLDTRRYEIGRYGRLRLAFLREKHPDVYTTLIFTGELGPQLVEFNAACRERVLSLTEELARREGVTEQLKRTDQLAWVGQMNNLRHRAEEIVLRDMVCSL